MSYSIQSTPLAKGGMEIWVQKRTEDWIDCNGERKSGDAIPLRREIWKSKRKGTARLRKLQVLCSAANEFQAELNAMPPVVTIPTGQESRFFEALKKAILDGQPRQLWKL